MDKSLLLEIITHGVYYWTIHDKNNECLSPLQSYWCIVLHMSTYLYSYYWLCRHKRSSTSRSRNSALFLQRTVRIANESFRVKSIRSGLKLASREICHALSIQVFIFFHDWSEWEYLVHTNKYSNKILRRGV